MKIMDPSMLKVLWLTTAPDKYGKGHLDLYDPEMNRIISLGIVDYREFPAPPRRKRGEPQPKYDPRQQVIPAMATDDPEYGYDPVCPTPMSAPFVGEAIPADAFEPDDDTA